MAFKVWDPTKNKDVSLSDNQIAKKSQKSAQWFRDSLRHNFSKKSDDGRKSEVKAQASVKSPIAGNSTINDPEFKKQTRKVKNIEVGRLYGYLYDPKGKKTLKYYDKFPLVLVLGLYPDSFIGLNLHYAPYPVRAKLLEWLYKNKKKTTRRGKEEELINVSYQILKYSTQSNIIAPMIKKYLYGHVKSPFVEFMMPLAMENAVFLPTEQFTKATKFDVWKDGYK